MKYLLIAMVLFGCSSGTHSYYVGPFYPENIKRCSGDNYCPSGYECRFLEVDTRAVCVPIPIGVEGSLP